MQQLCMWLTLLYLAMCWCFVQARKCEEFTTAVFLQVRLPPLKAGWFNT
jgi:hypothetical protein